MAKICDECGKLISTFGGSWEVNGKTVCTKCEKKLRESSYSGDESTTTVCDECGNPIGLFGGSWKIDGKTVCSRCERKIRLDLKDEKTEVIPQIEKKQLKKICSKCGDGNPEEAKFCLKCGEQIDKTEEIKPTSKTDATMETQPSFKGEYELIEETNEKKFVDRLDEYGKKNWEVCGYSIFPGAMGRGHNFMILKKRRNKK